MNANEITWTRKSRQEGNELMNNTTRGFERVAALGEAQVRAFFAYANSSGIGRSVAKEIFDKATTAYHNELDDMTPGERAVYDRYLENRKA